MNSDNGGREVEKDEKKGKRERQRKVGGQNSTPTLKLNLRLSQQKKKKKKLSFLKFSIYPKSQIFNSKFLFPNFQIHILNAQILNSTLQFSIKTQTSNFMIKILSLDFKNSKGSKFQILKRIFFQSLKSRNQNFKTSNFQKSNVSQKKNLLSIKLFLIKFKSRRTKYKITHPKSNGTTKHSSLKSNPKF